MNSLILYDLLPLLYHFIGTWSRRELICFTLQMGMLDRAYIYILYTDRYIRSIDSHLIFIYR